MISVRSSGIDRLIGCPGSPKLIEISGNDEKGSRDSWEGTWIHHRTAQRLVDELLAEAPAGGLPAPAIPDSYKPVGCDWVVSFLFDQVAAFTPTDWALVVEDYFETLFDRFLLTGHPDAYAISPDATEAMFWDFKAGRNLVDPADQNWQLFCYAVQMKRRWPTLTKIIGYLVQPRVDSDAGERVTVFTLEGEDMEKAPAFLEKKINHSLDNPYDLETGKHCRWCPAVLQCAQEGGAIHALIEDMKAKLTHETLKKIKARPDLEALCDINNARKMLQTPFKKASEMLKDALKDAREFTDKSGTRWYLRDALGSRYIPASDMSNAWDVLVDVLPAERVWEIVNVSVPAIETQLADHLGIPKESAVKGTETAKTKLDVLFGKFIKRDPETRLEGSMS